MFVVYLIFSFRSGKDDAEEEERGEVEAPKKLWYSIAMVLVGLASLVYGGDLLVDSACNLARDAGLSEKFIAITILAGGTSFPELVTCVVAAAKKKDALALGNIIGSNISNILLILGASALACPLSFANIKPVDLGMLVLSSVILIFSAWSGRNNRIGKGDATLFLIIFASYMAYLIMTI